MDSTDHLWFPISDYPMALEHEQSLLSQGRIDAGPAATRIAADSRDVVHVLTKANQAAYVLRSYDDLLMLSRPDGGSASLFDEHGWVRGSNEMPGPRLRHLDGLSLCAAGTLVF